MLSPEQVRQYRTDGFTVCQGFLPEGEVDRFRKGIDGICAGNTLARHDSTLMEMEPAQPADGTRVRRIYQPCHHFPEFGSLSVSDRLLDCVEQLLGPDLLIQYSKINMKPADVGSVVEWHQDLSYYPLTNRDSLAVLFYLDDASQSNGCLKIIPGRHTGPLLSHTRDGLFQGRVTEPVDGSGAVPVEGGAGTAIFMHCMAPHASAPNTSSHQRRTLILSYRAADAFRIYDGENTATSETFVRLVRGRHRGVARFTMNEFPIPTYPGKFVSLYDLQDKSRQSEIQQESVG